jgi:hypothetical protein
MIKAHNHPAFFKRQGEHHARTRRQDGIRNRRGRRQRRVAHCQIAARANMLAEIVGEG